MSAQDFTGYIDGQRDTTPSPTREHEFIGANNENIYYIKSMSLSYLLLHYLIINKLQY